MTPDTLMIDIRVPDVGRIKKRSGTLDRAVRRRMIRMVKDLRSGNPPRLDVLRALRDGSVSFLVALDAYSRQALHELPVGEAMPLVADAMKDWIADVKSDYSPEHAAAFETTRRYLKREDEAARVADLPRVLESLRKTLGKKYPRSFNLARAHVLAFTRSTLKRSHPIYGACLAVEERPVKRKTPKIRLTPDAIRGFFPNPGDHTKKEGKVDTIAWSMVANGMGQKELWGPWEVERDRVVIHGTKAGGRERMVPLVIAPATPPLSRDRFEKLFRERMGAAFSPYHLRRTYIQWLEASGIPRTRRRLYAGHGEKDVTDLYEAHEITEYLVADAAKLRTFLGLPEPPAAKGLGVVHGGKMGGRRGGK